MGATMMNDFILHIGDVAGEPRCALLRHPGDARVSSGCVSARRRAQGRYDLMLRTDIGELVLGGVGERHLDCVRGHGLLVLQKAVAAHATEMVLLAWAHK